MKKITLDQNEFLEIEKKFHDNYAKNLDWDKPIGNVLSYEISGIGFLETEIYFNKMLGSVNGKKILDIGSGFGNTALILAKNGAIVTSIDISSSLIEGCIYRAKKNNLFVDFQIMDASNLKFEDNTFDIILGYRSIHHLPNINEFLLNAHRCLKSGGFILFVEPQKNNPFVQFGRKFIRNREEDRTPTEHPLVPKDIKNMKEIFGNLEKHEFCFLSSACKVFDLLKWKKLYKLLDQISTSIDHLLWYLPFLRSLYWQVVLKCYKNQ